MIFASGPPPWEEDPRDSPVIATNVAALDADLMARRGHRDAFNLALPTTWHTRIHAGCKHIPVRDYVGNYRGAPLQHLDRYDVAFGPFRALPPNEVAASLSTFEADLERTLLRFDVAIADPGAATWARLNPLIDEIVVHYAEWIRIHPFADGNGRTARVLVNWILTRYWQPVIFPGRPPVDRPGLIAATAPALDSGTRDHRPLVRLLRRKLADARRG
ncbi:MAG: Fic family protein [Sporichthyaceae bacterium]